jgi:hypothetical protein
LARTRTDAPLDDALSVALDEACRTVGQRLTRPEQAERREALRALREVEATPQQVEARAAEYRRRWPHIECSAKALVAHWSKLAHERPAAAATNGRASALNPVALMDRLRHEQKQHAAQSPVLALPATSGEGAA